MKKIKGFTLAEVVIVIAIIGILLLIGTPAYGKIMERIRVKSDIQSGMGIGNAIAAMELDSKANEKIKNYPEVTKYSEVAEVKDFISSEYIPQSMPDGSYYVTAINVDNERRILVGIGKELPIKNKVYSSSSESGWVYIQKGNINDFIKENLDKLENPVPMQPEEITYTITTNSGINGKITPETVTVKEGKNKTFLIEPNNGYKVEDVIVDGESVGNVTGYTFSNVKSDHQIEATYAIEGYTISYNLNGGTATNPANYTIESSSIELTNPTRPGYVFSGWTGSNGIVPKFTVTIPSGSTGNKSYKANWNTTVYTINYDLKGGEVSGNPTNYTPITNSITLTNPTKTGYTFTGWTGSNGSTPELDVNIPTGSTGNRNYTANWIINTYEITVSSGLNGLISPSTKIVEYGSNQAFTITSNTGYIIEDVFVDGVSVISSLGGSETSKSYTFTNVTSEHEIVATYEVITYSISYSLNGGSASNPTQYTVASSEIVLSNPTKRGYTFTGWAGSNGSTPQKNVTIPTGSIGNKSYTANWSIVTYQIDYTLNSGTASNPTSYTITSSSITLTNPTRTGYTFKGWTGSNGSTPQKSVIISSGSVGDKNYTANWTINTYTITVTQGVNGTISPSNATVNYGGSQEFNILPNTGYKIKTLKVDGSSKSITNTAGMTYTFSNVKEDHVIEATYEADITYTVTYNTNGGSGGPSTQLKIHGVDLILSSTKPSRSGYTFSYWSTNTSGTGTNYDSGANYSTNANVTLYARWYCPGTGYTCNSARYCSGGEGVVPYSYCTSCDGSGATGSWCDEAYSPCMCNGAGILPGMLICPECYGSPEFVPCQHGETSKHFVPDGGTCTCSGGLIYHWDEVYYRNCDHGCSESHYYCVHSNQTYTGSSTSHTYCTHGYTSSHMK